MAPDSEPATLRRGNAPPSSDRVHVAWDGQSAEPIETAETAYTLHANESGDYWWAVAAVPARSTWADRIVFGLTGVLLGALVYCVCFGCTPPKAPTPPAPACAESPYETRCL